jgi:hypothetical protein
VLAEVVVYLLVLTKVMGNWWFVLGTGVIALVLPALGRVVGPEAFRAPAVSGVPRRPPVVPKSVATEEVPAVQGAVDARS